MEQNTQRTENFLPSKPSLPNSVEHFLIATEQTQKTNIQKRQKGTNQNRNNKTLTNVNKETNAMKIKQQRA